jgi:hypothetical protein
MLLMLMRLVPDDASSTATIANTIKHATSNI